MASLRAIATFAILRPRRIIRWTYLLRHSGMLRAVTCAASTSKKTRHRTSLFGNMPQPSLIPAGVFQRHQAEIARNLLPTRKALGFPDDQHEGQGGEWTDTGMGHPALRFAALLYFLLDCLAQLRNGW